MFEDIVKSGFINGNAGSLNLTYLYSFINKYNLNRYIVPRSWFGSCCTTIKTTEINSEAYTTHVQIRNPNGESYISRNGVPQNY